MTATLDPLPMDVLDDETQRSPEWESMREQIRRTGTIPRGTYEATLSNVAIVRRKDTRAWALRMIARTDRLGRYVHAWRGLSDNPDDAFDLTEGQVKALRKFAGTMGIPTPAPAAEIVEALAQRIGKPVVAKVGQTPVGQQVTLTVPKPEGTVEILPPATTDTTQLEGAAADAQVAHEKILEGLQAANFALARAAEGCHALLKDEGWAALGYESLAEYLAAPEVTLSRSEFYRLASIWERYVIDGGLEPTALQSAGPSKLEVALPALEQGLVSAEQAVADASSMTRSDLRTHYEQLQGGDGGDDTAPTGSEAAADESAAAPSDPEPVDDPAGGTDDTGPFDADELIRWAEHYGHPEGWAKKAQALHGKVENLEAEVSRLKHDFPLPDDRVLEVARSLSAVLTRVLHEVGRPEQKRMSKALRGVVVDTLAQASQHLSGSDA